MTDCPLLADLVPLERVPSLLPKRPHRSTVFRWVSKGCCGVHLRTVSVGTTRCTTEDWLVFWTTYRLEDYWSQRLSCV